VARESDWPSPVPERPSAAVSEQASVAKVEDEYETLNESEVSFASVAPPPSLQIRAVAPFLRRSSRPSGHPTPARTEVAEPASMRPDPLSDPAIQIPIDEDEE
jgi:hypothetical protein